MMGSSILKLILELQISSKKVKFTEDPSGFHSEIMNYNLLSSSVSLSCSSKGCCFNDRNFKIYAQD